MLKLKDSGILGYAVKARQTSTCLNKMKDNYVNGACLGFQLYQPR